jgi:hypothetical protein
MEARNLSQLKIGSQKPKPVKFWMQEAISQKPVRKNWKPEA